MRREQKKNGKFIYVIVGVLLILGVFSTIFALINATNSNIINGISINNIEVSGLSKSEAEEKLQKIINDIMEDRIILKHGEHEKIVTLKQMELEVDVIDKVYEACTTGRNGNIISNNYKILEIMLNGKNIDLSFKFNNEIAQSIYNSLDEEWEDKFIENSYFVDGDKLEVIRGKTGVIINKEELEKQIKNLVKEKIEGKKVKEINIPTITKNPEEFNLEKIKTEIYKEPKNASYDKSTSTLYPHTDGIDFGISIEEAKEILKEDKEEYEIPLKITKPEITTEKLGEEAFPNVLGTFSTRYDASNKNRSTNLELACEAIDGKILLPGERFSFNGVVGPRTKAKGYLLAGAYSAGELVESYGGGVCQVSTTIYNTALFANLEIVERYNHSLPVSYVNAGRDATVSYGSRDFKFKNSRQYAIKLKAEAKNGILKIEILGIKEKEELEIELTSEVTDTIPCTTKYVHDSSLAVRSRGSSNTGSKWCKKYSI